MRCLFLNLLSGSLAHFFLHLCISLFVAWEHWLFFIDVDSLVFFTFLFQPLHLLMSIEIHVAEHIENTGLLGHLQIVDQVVLKLLFKSLNVDFALA